MKAIKGHVLVKIDTKQKEKYALTSDITIHIEKNFNFNLREDKASFGFVIDSENVISGSMGLFHHLSTKESYAVPYLELFLTEKEILDGYRVFCIPHDMHFAYHNGNEWMPCENFLLTERVFEAYKGHMENIANRIIEKRIYVKKCHPSFINTLPLIKKEGAEFMEFTKKSLEGKCCIALPNNDYEIIFHMEDNREYRLIRTREREIVGVDDVITDKINKNELLLGLNEKDCKYLKDKNGYKPKRVKNIIG